MDHPADRQIFQTRLTPHRSLRPQGVRLLIGLFALCAFISSLPFVILGAWPIAGFMGLDIVLLYWAFKTNMRDARAYEDVSLSAIELKIAKVDADGHRQEWSFTPHWVRLETRIHDEDGVEQVTLVCRGKHIELASFLGRDARGEFVRAFTAALQQARRGIIYST